MAKRKARKTRTVTKIKRVARKVAQSPLKMVVPSMIYGGLRAKVSDALTPITSKVPVGDVADELVMLGTSYLAWKKGSGIIKKAGSAGMIIESARLGEAIASGSIMGGMTKTNVFGATVR